MNFFSKSTWKDNVVLLKIIQTIFTVCLLVRKKFRIRSYSGPHFQVWSLFKQKKPHEFID